MSWLSNSMQADEHEWIEVQSNYIIVINLKYNVTKHWLV